MRVRVRVRVGARACVSFAVAWCMRCYSSTRKKTGRERKNERERDEREREIASVFQGA